MSKGKKALLGASALVGAMALYATGAAAADAPAYQFNQPQQPLGAALRAYSAAADQEIIFADNLVRGRTAPSLEGAYTAQQALDLLLAGTDLSVSRTPTGVLRLEAAQGPQGGSAGNAVQALIVTAQKREEDIQDVPIAISAFSQEDLTRSQVAGGPDLMTQVPNMTFTKTNFSSYSIQLRGIGTQAISATVDPAVAVAFNNTPFIRNRFFEQEFYDLQRVEVLRGPQGTLYGRNATAGVVNLISQKARLDTYEAKLSGDIANYNSTRLEGMVNIPLANDVAALRIAGAWTKREGYTTNELSGEPIDGRDLWSTRVSLRFAPTDRLDVNLIWEHFQEDDDRLRSGKQLCKTHIVEDVAGIPEPYFYATLPEFGLGQLHAGVQPSLSQGCLPASLYSPESYQKTNPLALPYFVPLGAVSLPIAQYPVGHPYAGLPIDPYASRSLSPDLRVIEAAVEPSYRAKSDIVELQAAFDLTDTLTLSSETAWASDFIFSTQDYNRFAGAEHSWRTSGGVADNWLDRELLSPDGVFCDPQIGCSDRLVAMDLSTARSRQFSQELRLASSFDGPFNFSLGGNFLRYDTEDKYYVFINSATMVSAYSTINQTSGIGQWIPGVTDNRSCLTNGMIEPDYTRPQPVLRCTYIDPNPITSLNDLGHNYFLSRNPYKLISYAVFGEAYYNLADNLKVTAGLRWTVDRKEAPSRPSWLLASNTVGHPIHETVNQEWSKPTGRLAMDWKPDLAFTDETMVYASLAHGYKAGGMNPPPYGKAILVYGIKEDNVGDTIAAGSAVHPKTFEAEYVDALEFGAKNTLMNGAMTVNLAGFYYEYQGYQLSQIVNRSAVTNNFDSTIWGLELESDWRPVEYLRFGLKLGYTKTRVADGEQAIDVMDRTAGRQGWVVHKPFPSIPSNCVIPEWLLVGNTIDALNATVKSNPGPVNVGGVGGGNVSGCEVAYILNQDPATGQPFTVDPPVTATWGRLDIDYPAWSTDPADYPCWPAGVPITRRDYPGVDPACLAAMSNNGEGFFKDLSGKEFPNAPHMTATITADYTLPLPNEWLMTLHTDLYYQSEAWTRIFNTEGYDKLKAYSNINLAAIFTNEEQGWKVMAYVKNVLDRDSITGAFLNSDDSGLTTNVFLTEPRLYGVRITKDFDGGPWWTGANPDHVGPYPLTIEFGGQVQRHEAPYEALNASWVAGLPAELALDNVQDKDLDLGDGRSLKVTYKPVGSGFSIWADVRTAETNNDVARTAESLSEIRTICGFTNIIFFLGGCTPGSAFYQANISNINALSWSDAEGRAHEESTAANAAVGYDLQLSGPLSSTISAGVRHAELESESYWAANAQTDWFIPQGWYQPQPAFASSNARKHAVVSAMREFSGTGPALTWDAGLEVWGGTDTGRVTLDWSVAAAALFGERLTTISGEERLQAHKGNLVDNADAAAGAPYATINAFIPTDGPPVITPIDMERREDATVPVLDLSLGLAYEVGRIKLGAGYRWERYFDALDVGYTTSQDADRTIDGPYLKLSIGFGG